MKKGWNKIGKVARPQKSLVIVDGQGNVMAKKISLKIPKTLKPKAVKVSKPKKVVKPKVQKRKLK
jgi:hypothetical protein